MRWGAAAFATGALLIATSCRLIRTPQPRRFSSAVAVQTRISPDIESHRTNNPTIDGELQQIWPFVSMIAASTQASTLYASPGQNFIADANSQTGPKHVAGRIYTHEGGKRPTFPLTPLLTFGVSLRPAPPAPKVFAPFSQLQPAAQEQLIRLLRTRSTSDPKAALDLLGEFIKGTTTPGDEDLLQPRVEVTFSQTLSLPSEWERLQYGAFYLILHEHPDVIQFSDTNQLESVIRDLQLGSLTQYNEIAAGLNVDASITGVQGAEDTGKTTRVLDPKPSISAKATDQLVRTITLQLASRAPAIENNGRIFRLTVRSALDAAIPSMMRQILTLQFTRPPVREPIFTAPLDDNGRIKELKRRNVLKPDLHARHLPIRATPVAAGWARRVTSQSTAKTVLEDDDKVEYYPQFQVLKPVTLKQADFSSWGLEIRLGSINNPSGAECVNNGQSCHNVYLWQRPIGVPDLALFATEQEAADFAQHILSRIQTLAATPQIQIGDILESQNTTVRSWRVLVMTGQEKANGFANGFATGLDLRRVTAPIEVRIARY